MSWRYAESFQADEGGVSAVEFALMLPLLLVLFFGGYVLCEEVALSRKVTITTRAMADLVTKYTSMSTTDMSTVLGASTQIVAPFDATPLQLRVSEITTDSTGLKATVTWSTGVNPYPCNNKFTLPTSLLGYANVSFIYSEVTYVYTPAVNIYVPVLNVSATPKVSLTDRIYMLPRSSNTVTYSCPG